MPTSSSTRIDTPPGRSAGLLLGLTGALLALLILNLAVFDDLRLDASAGVLETFAKPQHLASLVAVLIAGVLLAFKHRSAARVAAVVAWTEIAAFTFFHLVPTEVGPSKPYWGEGMGDPLQWVGLVAILVVSAAIVGAVRRAPKPSAAPLGEVVGDDHAGTLAATVVTDGSGVRRTAPTMAALTTRIETRPTHWLSLIHI